MDIESLANRRWILLPGTLCTAEVFTEFLNQVGVKKELRCSIPLKYAQVEDYLPTIKELMHPGDVVCGFSLGAIIAAHLADQLDASALLLFGLNPFADDPANVPGRQSLEAAVRSQGGSNALRSGLPPIHGPSPDHVKQRILAMADSTASLIGAQTHLAINRPGALPSLSNSLCPIRALTGSEDTNAPVESIQAAAEVATNVRVQILEGLGHYALLEDAKLCYETFIR